MLSALILCSPAIGAKTGDVELNPEIKALLALPEITEERLENNAYVGLMGVAHTNPKEKILSNHRNIQAILNSDTVFNSSEELIRALQHANEVDQDLKLDLISGDRLYKGAIYDATLNAYRSRDDKVGLGLEPPYEFYLDQDKNQRPWIRYSPFIDQYEKVLEAPFITLFDYEYSLALPEILINGVVRLEQFRILQLIEEGSINKAFTLLEKNSQFWLNMSQQQYSGRLELATIFLHLNQFYSICKDIEHGYGANGLLKDNMLRFKEKYQPQLTALKASLQIDRATYKIFFAKALLNDWRHWAFYQYYYAKNLPQDEQNNLYRKLNTSFLLVNTIIRDFIESTLLEDEYTDEKGKLTPQFISAIERYMAGYLKGSASPFKWSDFPFIPSSLRLMRNVYNEDLESGRLIVKEPLQVKMVDGKKYLSLPKQSIRRMFSWISTKRYPHKFRVVGEIMNRLNHEEHMFYQLGINIIDKTNKTDVQKPYIRKVIGEITFAKDGAIFHRESIATDITFEPDSESKYMLAELKHWNNVVLEPDVTITIHPNLYIEDTLDTEYVISVDDGVIDIISVRNFSEYPCYAPVKEAIYKNRLQTPCYIYYP